MNKKLIDYLFLEQSNLDSHYRNSSNGASGGDYSPHALPTSLHLHRVYQTEAFSITSMHTAQLGYYPKVQRSRN